MELLCMNEDIEKKISRETELRGFSRQTKESYIFHIRKFLDFIRKPARRATLTDVKRYVLHLRERKQKPATVNVALAAIKFLYVQLWNRKSFMEVRPLKNRKRAPTIMPREAIEKMIRAVPNIKHKLFIELLYSSGLRVGEAVSLKLKHIMPEERIMVIRNGKGGKDRYVMLSQRFICRLKVYMERRHLLGINSEYLFSSRKGHITTRTGEAIIKNAAGKAGIRYNVFPHALRASFATHMLEKGEDIGMIQLLLGHADIKTTRIYARHSTGLIKKVQSPMDY
ncbi:tyrosine-type recombinase/integrase [Candidatus Woesearchaeota archaeon]|nr:tyrosine-type recombinase/integrase [Candidatus Woesearchaeota archaeon]